MLPKERGMWMTAPCWLLLLLLLHSDYVRGLELRFSDPSDAFLVRRDEIAQDASNEPMLDKESKDNETKKIDNNDVFSFGYVMVSEEARLVASVGSISTTRTLRRPSKLAHHVISHTIPKDRPVTKVVLYGPKLECVQLLARLGGSEHVGLASCIRRGGKNDDHSSKSCLLRLRLPSSWWPQLSSSQKPPKASLLARDKCEKSKEEVKLADLNLTPPISNYRQLGHDNNVHLLVPQVSLYSHSVLFVPVLIQVSGGDVVQAITVKCRARRGARVVGVEASEDGFGAKAAWAVSMEKNARGSAATAHAKLLDPKSQLNKGPHEVFNWVLEFSGSKKSDEHETKVMWHVTYELKSNISSSIEERQLRVRARLNLEKDELESLVPIVQHPELVNLAPLSGSTVTQPLRVLVASHAGELSDVTLQSSCTSRDETLIKVSPSCTSVFVDGSESPNGALAASIEVKYNNLVSVVDNFVVWAPQLPLNIELDDQNLAVIKDWSVPIEDEQLMRDMATKHRLSPSTSSSCRPRLQQTRVRVWGRFQASDTDSGRKKFFPGRDTSLDLTHLLVRNIEVDDEDVVQIVKDEYSNVVLAKAPGQTGLRLRSPVTRAEIGFAEVTVRRDERETVTHLEARVVTHIDVEHDKKLIRVATGDAFDHIYQEAALDISVVTSDNKKVDLNDIDRKSYIITMDENRALALKKDSNVLIALSGISSSSIQFALSTECSRKLVGKSARLPLHFGFVTQMSTLATPKTTLTAVDMGHLWAENVALRDEQRAFITDNYHRNDLKHVRGDYDNMMTTTRYTSLTTLELGLIALLAVFFAAIAVFAVSCFAYASKVQQTSAKSTVPTPQSRPKMVQSAHDWVWLGRTNTTGSDHKSASSMSANTLDMRADLVLHNNWRQLTPRHHARVGPRQQQVLRLVEAEHLDDHFVLHVQGRRQRLVGRLVENGDENGRCIRKELKRDQNRHFSKKSIENRREYGSNEGTRSGEEIDTKTYVVRPAHRRPSNGVRRGERVCEEESEALVPAPLKQSPASALPPFSFEQEEIREKEELNDATKEQNGIKNPLEDVPSPPRSNQGDEMLDLDYDQMMAYFEGLKESSA